MQTEICKEISNLLMNNDFSKLDITKLSEKDLLIIATELKSKEKEAIKLLIKKLTTVGLTEGCDWNIGSILQHMNFEFIVEELENIPINQKVYLYDSIGLSWALGESDVKDNYITEFLYEILNYTRNSESWWKAAFALEKITGKSAINNLKRSIKKQGIKDIDYCLKNLADKKNVISLLLNANSKEIKEKIYPIMKKKFFKKDTSKKEFLNLLWLFGRLRLFDNEIYEKTLKVLKTTDEYEMIYYIFHSMAEDPKNLFYAEFLKCIRSDDPLIRKMAIRGISEINTEVSVKTLESLLDKETIPSVVGEITKAIYKIKNEKINSSKKMFAKYLVNENGLIGDDTDKWYADASIYNIFSEAEDVENVCFNLIINKLKSENIKIVNPVDIATGSGRTFKNILNDIKFEGTLYGVDLSSDMLNYLRRTIDRQKYYIHNIELIENTIEDFKLPNDSKSSLIISSFGFPSKISSKDRCIKELKAIYNNLSDDGIFITIGWDETFNDELNEMWYRYIPDNIIAKSFDEWHRKRAKSITTPRNCYLTWWKTNMQIPLQFSNLEETVNVMGHLFGRDAASEMIKTGQQMWWMSMGITYDTKESIRTALEKLGAK